MALFGFGKKKEEEKKNEICGCSCGCSTGTLPPKETELPLEGAVRSIKVLGSGCKNCHALLENAQEAVRALSLPVEVEYITDMEKVATYGAMSMPALVVNEKVVSMGKVLKPDDVEKLLHKLGF